VTSSDDSMMALVLFYVVSYVYHDLGLVYNRHELQKKNLQSRSIVSRQYTTSKLNQSRHLSVVQHSVQCERVPPSVVRAYVARTFVFWRDYPSY
jgi:hypothetical protein